MRYIESYNIFKRLNESLLSDDQRMVNREFLKMADPNTGICMWDGHEINPNKVVTVVENALEAIQEDWPYWYSFLSDFHIIWADVSHMGVDTMAVDEHLNLYINPVFVQYYLKNKLEYAQFVLMHEMMHVVFRHVRRSKNYLENSINSRTWRDTNLAGDLEINTFLTLLGAITRDEIKNEIGGGVILDEVKSVIALEDILDSDDLMDRLKSNFDRNDDLPQPPDGGDPGGDGTSGGNGGDPGGDGPTGGQHQMSPDFLKGCESAAEQINSLVDRGLTTEEIINELNKILNK